MAGDKRIDGLTIETVKAWDQKLAIDKAAYTEARSLNLEVLQRTRVSKSQSEISSSSATLDFSAHEQILLIIAQDFTATISNVPNNSVNYLKVTKGSTDVITFVGADEENEAFQNGLTEIWYKVTGVNGDVILERLNTQLTQNLVIGDFSSTSGTVTTFDYFESTINDNICSFEGSFTFTTSSLVDSFTINIANWNIQKKQSSFTSTSNYVRIDDERVSAIMIITDTYLSVFLPASYNDDVEIKLNGQFKVS